ncbi:hypothetical protein E4U42_004957 [Claviceps africana]|uniref:Uncharacterized protein n=1 Tax=Claviceps africana TaxID=83212 RepID=A0A8K0NJ72_9HYPO|nr:hypothetical protein E4U42_004957 [Claviceps africana]
MKTRTSTRPRKPPPETHSFQSSSPSASPPPSSPPRRRPRPRRRSSSFTAPDSAPDGSPPPHDHDDEATSSRPPPRPSARRDAKRAPAVNPLPGRTRPPPGTYLDVESVTTDTHLKGYTGPYDRSMRGQTLVTTWYGPDAARVRALQGLLDRWMPWTVLPPKCAAPVGEADNEPTPATPAASPRGTSPGYPPRPQRSVPLHGPAREPFQQPRLAIRLLMGPSLPDSGRQREYTMYPGDSIALSHAWLPYPDDPSDEKRPAGWILDAGGIVTGMDWCPRPAGSLPQLLALAVVPHADQRPYHYESEHQRPDFHAHGTVQVWALEAARTDDGVLRPSPLAPRPPRTICMHFGRITRLRWRPIEPDATPSAHVPCMAVLCGDGRVCVVALDDGDDASFDYIVHVEATLMLENEASVKATAMAWATPNRLVLGYSDGSIALWSVYPCFLISRHPVHHSLVVDLATGYPSQPFLVASTPVGGVTKLVDLSRPTFDTTEVQTNAVTWQPNMLAYSPHLHGYFSVYPSANALNTMVAFLHQRFFPIVRRVFVGESYNSSLAVGRTHPFLLIGSTDGSLWSLNPQVELFNSRREPTDRLRIFQHEHRSKDLFPHGSPASERGASRFLHGFAVEKGRRPKGEVKVQPAKKQKRPKKADAGAVDGIEDDDDEEAAGVMDPTRGIVYEPLSRVTSIEWNPNRDVGCWAAAATASGLVRVMDLGLDNVPG